MAARIRSGDLTSIECVEACIARVEACHPSLNAMVARRFSEARAEAREWDRRPRGQAPFQGVPCSVKEAFAVSGMPNAAGLVARRKLVAESDAETVARLRRAGFVVLGVSNTSELCMWCESANPLYGRTASAAGPHLTAGGSSGGEAALVGASCVPVGLGSDIGGSIRMPAYFNGVFGLKPSAGLVSNQGQFPCAKSSAGQLFLTTGPIVRKAEDLFPLLQVLAKNPAALIDPATVEVSKLRVVSMETLGMWLLHPPEEAIAAQRDFLGMLGRMGCEVETRPPFALFKDSLDMWSGLLQQHEPESFGESLFEKKGVGALRALKELFLWTVGMSDHSLPAVGLALLENLTKLQDSPERFARLQRQADELRDQIEAMLGDDGVLLFPSFATLPPDHSSALLFPVRWIYTAIFNTLHLPAVQVPLGVSRDGRPLGCQIIAKRNRDHLAIAVANML